jgi:type IV pilus assembly protein PilV
VAAGFSLLEVLIALVVLTIGLLGTAMLYMRGLQDSRTALLRMQAVTLAADILDRARANHTGNVNYDTTVTTAPALVTGCETTAGCSTAQMAANDLYRWQQAIAVALPGGTGTVTVAGITAASYKYTVTITWTEVGSSSATYTVIAEI